MAIQYINTGSSANAGNGDSLRSAFIKVNNNFAYLSSAGGGSGNGYTGSRGNIGYTGSRGAGAPGAPGYAGSMGYTGSTGIGYTGSAGIGYTGSAGIPGITIIPANTIGALAYYANTGTITGLPRISYNQGALFIGDKTTGTINSVYIENSVSTDGFGRGFTYANHIQTTDANNFTFYRTRGTPAAPTALQFNDEIVDINFLGHNGTTATYGFSITAAIDQVPVGGQQPMRLVFAGNNNAGQIVPHMVIGATGTVRLNNLGAIATGTHISVSTSLIPKYDVTYDLGSIDNQWRSLYVSSSTVYINRTPLTIDDQGTLLVNGSSILGTPGYSGSQGSLGYTGSRGDTGYVGSLGNIGFTGSRGLLGYDGSRGDTGYVGSLGDIGFTGSRGLLGYDGSRGDTGYVGSQGDIGYVGSEGSPGQQGYRGYTGSEGAQGSPGQQGRTGDQGISVTLVGSTSTSASLPLTGNPGDGWIVNDTGNLWFWSTLNSQWENIGQIVGPQGDPGYVGSKGAQGDIGLPGDLGYTGSTGANGYVGSRGDTGYAGSQGELGYVGSQGDVGYAGSQGELGYVGSQGDIGYVGSQGELGYVGSQGELGYVGSQGDVGYVGSQGDSGYTGSTGGRGFQGYTGSQGEQGPGADQSLNTTNSVEFFSLKLTNGDDSNGSNSYNQLAFSFGGTTDYPHYIRTRHNDSDYAGNAFDFYTNTDQTGGPDTPRHGLTINNGWVGVNGNTAPDYALDVNGNAGAAANRFFVKNDGKLVFNQLGSIITEARPGTPYEFFAIPADTLTGTGFGAALNVQFGAGDLTYGTVLLNNGGEGFYIGDTLKVTGDLLGGTTPANDLIVEITSMANAHAEPWTAETINVISGVPVAYTDGLHVRNGGYEWTFGNNGTLTVPGTITKGNRLTLLSGGASGNVASVVADGDAGRVFVRTLGGEDAILQTWEFNKEGKLILPVGGDIVDIAGQTVLGGGSSPFTIGTVDLHNGGVQNSQILQFTDSDYQSVITGPTPAAGNNAQRLIIQGQRATGQGEGGDVYVWGGDAQTDGGDIKIYAGDADGNTEGYGGYVNISAGNGFTQGGSINITAGNSSNGTGGDITIAAGVGSATVGRILINNNLNEWSFDREGDFRLANHIIARNGRYYQDCADGTTSMRWINAESENNDIELVRVYRDGGSPYDGQQNEENERVQLGYKDIAPDVSVFYIKTTKNPAGLFVTDEDDKRWEFQSTGGVKFPDATVQTTAFTFSNSATAPTTGLLWFNPTEGRMYVKYNDQWVDASPTVLAPPDTNPTLESVTFNDATQQTTAWTGTVSYNNLTDKPAFAGGGGASTWLTAD